MKTIFFLAFIFPFLLGINLVKGQGFNHPSEGKAVVFFKRVSGYGAVNKFKFFHSKNYIGTLKGKQYLRYGM